MTSGGGGVPWTLPPVSMGGHSAPLWGIDFFSGSAKGFCMGLIIEIRAAEGGDDAKLLVQEQFGIYARLCARRGL